MKFSVSQSSLSKALAVVSKGMASNSTLPILSGIYIKAESGVLEFQTTDLTISVRHRIAANVEESGASIVSGKLLSNIVKNLPDAAVSFEESDHAMLIECGKSHYRLNTLDASDFPEFPQYQLERSIELPSALLSEMVDKVYKVTSKDSSRPVLSGILLSVEENTIRLVATDSYRLAVCDSNTETSSSDEAFQAIVAGTIFHDVLTLPSMTETILIGTSSTQVVFSFGDTTYVSRRIDGNFPDYKVLLPPSCSSSVKVDVAQFSAALKRVSVIALTNPSVHFDIDADGKMMKLSASAPDQGESAEYLPVEVEGESVSIALNYHYVFDCVNAASSEKELTLELQSAMKPGIFKSYSKINYLYLLMPVWR
ncbi:DNA polymerase III subunit beta [Olsenella urininfantis]|uniref:DNA polymerase III subunit beta n=1 Tax=Olsenella urininfantis TaxID=1871033 RepID=UPI0009877C4B|nr:DNA polymerase III subunit beta [Olsenella urininfantis]